MTKWLFLAGVVLFAFGLAAVLRSKPRYMVPSAFVFGVSVFILGPSLWAAPIPWPGWPGPVQGLEISFIDAFSVAFILSTRPTRIPWSLKLPFTVLCIALIISTSVASQWMPSFFYVWQLLRAVLLFVAIARLCTTAPSAPIALIAGLGVGLVYEAGFAAFQFAHGDARPGGNLGHSNFLGLASDFVVFPTMALLMGTRRFWWPAAVIVAGLVIAVVGGSRATMGLYVIGLFLTLIFSLQHGGTPRKFAFAGGAAVLLLMAVPLAIWAADRRSEENKISSDTERDSMKLAARMMFADHPFGVGANEYVVVANTVGYSQRAGVAWNYTSRSAPVHDTYYLIAAELGFIGLGGFIALLGGLILLGLRALRQRLDEDINELVPGLIVTMVIAAVHISFEFVFMYAFLHYLFALSAGLLVGIKVVAERRRALPHRVQMATGRLASNAA